MRVKSYFVARVEEAMAAAARDLGGDALLVNTRRTTADQEHLGRYEVVFATDVPAAPTAPATVAASTTAPLASIREQLELVRRKLQTAEADSSKPALLAEAIEHELNATGLDDAMVRELVTAIDVQSAAATAAWKTVAGRIVEERLSKLNAPVAFDTPGHTHLVLGLPGRGKTATVAKLALRLGVEDGPAVRIASLNANGSSAARYPALRGVAMQNANSISELRSALSRSHEGITLVDTPGPGPGGFQDAGLASLCRNHRALAVHLVLRADASLPNLLQAIERFRHYDPVSLIFTGVDEVSAYGSLVSAALFAKLPVSVLGTGQDVSTDFELGTPRRLAELVIYRQRLVARAAA